MELSAAAREQLARAELIAGGRRHLALAAALGKPTFEWETPFAASIPKLLAHRGRRVVVLCSGDPFWYGAGAVLAEAVPAVETIVVPALSTFAWAAARLRWRLEETITLGLHARPIELLRPHLRTGARLIVLARDGAAPAQIANYLTGIGFGPSRLTVLEALGGPQERIRAAIAADFVLDDIKSPVALAIEAVAGPDVAIMPRVAGLPDELFVHDGQLTKREIRAVTLSTLAPRGGELLWDVGAGSGAIGIEWLLAHPANRAIGIEAREDRLNTARGNAQALGVPHFDLRLGSAPEALKDLPTTGRRVRRRRRQPRWRARRDMERVAAEGPAGGQFGDAGNRGAVDCVAGAPWRRVAALVGRARRPCRRPHRLARGDAGGAVERHQMSPRINRLVIGLGFRDVASAQSIGEVLAGVALQAARPELATVIAVVADKAAHPGLRAAAQIARLPIETVAIEAMRQADTRVTTRSELVLKKRGVGSVSEATALAAAGAGARLIVTRMVSADRTATAAAALSEEFAP